MILDVCLAISCVNNRVEARPNLRLYKIQNRKRLQDIVIRLISEIRNNMQQNSERVTNRISHNGTDRNDSGAG